MGVCLPGHPGVPVGRRLPPALRLHRQGRQCAHIRPPPNTPPALAAPLPPCRSLRRCSSRRTAPTTPARWGLGWAGLVAGWRGAAATGGCHLRALSRGPPGERLRQLLPRLLCQHGCQRRRALPAARHTQLFAPARNTLPPQVLTAVIKKAQLPGDNIDNRDSFANVKASAAFRCVLGVGLRQPAAPGCPGCPGGTRFGLVARPGMCLAFNNFSFVCPSPLQDG